VKKIVRPSPFAEDEIEYYVRRYESEAEGLGGRLWIDIQNVVDLISEHPLIGEAVQRTRGLVRRFPLRSFPFFMIYRERGDHLQIIARPNYWRDRLKFD
jgi:plasmid stabilization system protein ParE